MTRPGGTTSKTTFRKGECQRCGQFLSVRRDGSMMWHRGDRLGKISMGANHCSGVDLPPKDGTTVEPKRLKNSKPRKYVPAPLVCDIFHLQRDVLAKESWGLIVEAVVIAKNRSEARELLMKAQGKRAGWYGGDVICNRLGPAGFTEPRIVLAEWAE